MTDYSEAELMVTAAARELGNDDTVLVGVGIPNIACNLAKHTHAPDLELVYESGTIDSRPESLPLSIGDPGLATNATQVIPIAEGFRTVLQAGRIDVGFLGGAQIDSHGSINSTVIGDYDDPTVRLPGSGGACEIAINAHRTIVITPHTERRFPATLDFVTSPGHIDPDTRDRFGMRGGPDAVITDKAIMRFHERELTVTSIHPHSSREAIQAATGWELAFAADVDETAPPDETERSLIRETLDPDGQYT